MHARAGMLSLVAMAIATALAVVASASWHGSRLAVIVDVDATLLRAAPQLRPAVAQLPLHVQLPLHAATMVVTMDATTVVEVFLTRARFL